MCYNEGMVRHLGCIGFLTVFTALAFVPPGEGQAAYIQEKGSILPRNIAFQDIDAVVPLVTSRISQIDKKEVLHQATSLTASFIGFAAKNIESNASSKQWRDIASSSDAQTRSRFLAIEWAREKNDRTTCGNLSDDGNWIAYCLARVTRNASRCDQIAPLHIPDVKTLCENEFGHDRDTPSFLATLLL